ncbi:uncharacterized protein HKW66_Vig0087570 [Vigna angularis]|uniref:Bifunctional inhibitor/plant lipid transfer protein/seed storage helical domain-containing protein n=1 Tax=Phaseolus angularis TaxID=3914 RepID=A0A8T0KIC0_PHAAN|nr:uncharacterized protein HKW66_Vig0087570 [Vigna angularis]
MGLMKCVLAVFLSLSLVSVSMVRSQRTRCALDRDGLNELNTCRSLLDLEDVIMGGSAAPTPSSSCCSILRSLENPSQPGLGDPPLDEVIEKLNSEKAKADDADIEKIDQNDKTEL